MRGKAFMAFVCFDFIRITPAYAGKSRGRMTHEVMTEDHPRVCGEKSLKPKSRKNTVGSPPRMRGKV